MSTNRIRWRLAAFTAGLVLLVGLIIIRFVPAQRDVAWLMLYTVPSHMFVSPFPHEPLLLYYAKTSSHLACTLASMIGCLAAGILDYALFTPLVHHPRVRPRYTQATLYRRSAAFFKKWPFWALVVVGYSPIPIYPIKFLSIAERYPLKRYLAALVVGRFPRYFTLAYLGYVLQLPNWSLVALAGLLLVLALVKHWRDRAHPSDGNDKSPPL